MLPCRLAENGGAQTSMSGPAFAAGLFGSKTMMFTVSCVNGGTQGPLKMVHRKEFTPTPRPETIVFRLFGLANTPVPASTDQVPFAGWAFSWVLVCGRHNCWSGPASAAGAA